MFRDKLKNIFNKEENEKQDGNNKRKIENLVVFLIILIITIVAINIIWNGDNTKNIDKNTTNTKQLATDNVNEINANNSTEINSNTNLKENLEEILSKIKGVGDVQVFINYSESNEVVPMYNENSKISNTEESDTSGGTRKVQETDSQKEVIYQEENGEKTPITQKVIEPKVEGAIVTARGASDATVKTSIIQAVEAVTGLATHKIQVFEMN